MVLSRMGSMSTFMVNTTDDPFNIGRVRSASTASVRLAPTGRNVRECTTRRSLVVLQKVTCGSGVAESTSCSRGPTLTTGTASTIRAAAKRATTARATIQREPTTHFL